MASSHAPVFTKETQEKFKGVTDKKEITKIDLSEVTNGKPCIILKNVLSPDECKILIEASEKVGFQDAQEYCHLYRRRLNDRLMSDDKNFTKMIFDRVQKWIPESVETPGYKNKTKWDLLELNSRWRYCRYFKGHYFGYHTDGAYRPSPYSKSFLTFMLYLNGPQDGSFVGGSTNFLDEKVPGWNKVKKEIIPEPGMALVFLQEDTNLMHEGAKLMDGRKYILRTDVMYGFVKPDYKNPPF